MTGVFDYSSKIFSTSYPGFRVWKVQSFPHQGGSESYKEYKALVLGNEAHRNGFCSLCKIQCTLRSRAWAEPKIGQRANWRERCRRNGFAWFADGAALLRCTCHFGDPLRAIPMPEMPAVAAAQPHAALAALWGCQECGGDRQSTSWLPKPVLGDKGGFGSEWESSFIAKARLMALLCPFMNWEISACFLAPFSEWEAVGMTLWSDKERRHTANSGNHRDKEHWKKTGEWISNRLFRCCWLFLNLFILGEIVSTQPNPRLLGYNYIETKADATKCHRALEMFSRGLSPCSLLWQGIKKHCTTIFHFPGRKRS